MAAWLVGSCWRAETGTLGKGEVRLGTCRKPQVPMTTALVLLCRLPTGHDSCLPTLPGHRESRRGPFTTKDGLETFGVPHTHCHGALQGVSLLSLALLLQLQGEGAADDSDRWPEIIHFLPQC